MISEPTVDVARVHASPLNPNEALLGTSTPSTNASSLQGSQASASPGHLRSPRQLPQSLQP